MAGWRGLCRARVSSGSMCRDFSSDEVQCLGEAGQEAVWKDAKNHRGWSHCDRGIELGDHPLEFTTRDSHGDGVKKRDGDDWNGLELGGGYGAMCRRFSDGGRSKMLLFEMTTEV